MIYRLTFYPDSFEDGKKMLEEAGLYVLPTQQTEPMLILAWVSVIPYADFDALCADLGNENLIGQIVLTSPRSDVVREPGFTAEVEVNGKTWPAILKLTGKEPE